MDEWPLGRRLEFVGKYAAQAVGCAYALGLLVSNLHLARFGVYSAGLFRTEYVLTGPLTAFAVLWYAAFFALLGAAWKGVRTSAREKQYWRTAVAAGALVFFARIPMFSSLFWLLNGAQVPSSGESF